MLIVREHTEPHCHTVGGHVVLVAVVTPVTSTGLKIVGRNIFIFCVKAFLDLDIEIFLFIFGGNPHHLYRPLQAKCQCTAGNVKFISIEIVSTVI